MGASLANRGKVAASRGRRHADTTYGDDTHQQGGSENLVPVPPAEAVDMPAGDESKITNTPANLVARLQRNIYAKGADLQRDIHAYQRMTAYMNRTAEDDHIIEPSKVNPPLSGTDEQSLKGDDFESVQPTATETQPKDASLHAFARFDRWLQDTTGRTAAQHGNANFIRRQAASYSKAAGVQLDSLFPALGHILRQARNEGEAMQYRAEFDGAAVAPDARVDVEKPVKNVTDADAQAAQYNLKDYGKNAGDDLADPDLETSSQIFYPKESSHNKMADAVAAVRYAEAWLNAGLEGDKWQLVAQAQMMRQAAVVDRIRILEKVAETNAARAARAPKTRVAAAVSRGTGIPRGLTSRPAPRVAANDTSGDVGIWL